MSEINAGDEGSTKARRRVKIVDDSKFTSNRVSVAGGRAAMPKRGPYAPAAADAAAYTRGRST